MKIKNQNIVEEAGKMIPKELLATKFGLRDSFGDEADLKNSWENVLKPDCLLTFFASLFKIPKSKLFKQSIDDLNNLFKPPEDTDDDEHKVNVSDYAAQQALIHLKIAEIYRIVFFKIYHILCITEWL